jgi:hypothetical protein
MIGIYLELPGFHRSLEPIKHGAAQAITGMNGSGQDRRSGNPVVARLCGIDAGVFDVARPAGGV